MFHIEANGGAELVIARIVLKLIFANPGKGNS